MGTAIWGGAGAGVLEGVLGRWWVVVA